jgi:hypothetical protein
MTGLSLLVLLAVALVAPAQAPAAPTVGDAKAEGKRVVVSPRPGQLIRANRALLRVRARNVAGALAARLNGVPIGADFGRARKGVRTLRTSVSHGLRRGRNTLRVRVRELGKRPRTHVVRFRVRTIGPLVGAGRDRRVVVGERIDLGGRVGSRRRGERVRWRLVKRPGARASRAPVKLFRASRAGADFKATRPGRYTLRLTRGRGRALRSDTVTLSAVHATPLVSVQTIPGGKPGIEVAGTTYPADVPGGGSAAFMQVVVLERLTLARDSNTTYTNTDQLASALNALTADKALASTRLVLVAMPKPAAGAQPLSGGTGLLAALRPIGVANGDAGSGAVSAIGVPGLSAGDANVSVDPHGGGIDGYLTPDQNLEYGFISPERQVFDFTQRHPGCPPVDPGINDVGFKVSLIDPYDLTCNVRIFPTNGIGLTDTQRDQAARDMGAHLIAAPPGYLVRIEPTRTINDLGRPLIGAIQTDTAFNLANIVAALGGTRHGFNTAAYSPVSAVDAPSQYSLIGWKGAEVEGIGEEAAFGVDGVTDASTLNGILRRDRTYRFRPVQTTTGDAVDQRLQNLILKQPTSAWPLDGQPGPAAALAYISQTADNRLGCDPRNSYWTQLLTESDINAILAEVRAVQPPDAKTADPCTGKQVDFSGSDFTTARGQLIQELTWLSRTKSYMQLLASPFADGGIKRWATVSDVAAEVYSSSHEPDGEVAVFWSEFSSLFLKLLAPVTGGVSGEVADVLDFGMWMAGRGTDGSPGGESLSVAANQLGAQLVEQASQAQATYVAMGNVIASDYSKLRVVGANGGCNPTAPDCDKDFSYPSEQKAALSAAVSRSAERLAYEKLLPVGYNVFQLAMDMNNVRNRSVPPDPKQYNCGGGTYAPWSRYPSSLAWTSLLQGYDPVNHTNNYQTYVLSVPQNGSLYHGTPPDTETLERMFDPVSKSLTASDGGLDISVENFMRDARHYGWTGQGPGGDSCYFLD